MKVWQFAFWMVIAALYGAFAVFHFQEIEAHLDPIPELSVESPLSVSTMGERIGMWEPTRDAIYETNTRITQLNASNDRLNRTTAVGYAITAFVAFACGCFTIEEMRSATSQH